jgi:hypothetical protein
LTSFSFSSISQEAQNTRKLEIIDFQHLLVYCIRPLQHKQHNRLVEGARNRSPVFRYLNNLVGPVLSVKFLRSSILTDSILATPCGELNYLTPHAFWNIADFGAKCEKCETINTITLEKGNLRNKYRSDKPQETQRKIVGKYPNDSSSKSLMLT